MKTLRNVTIILLLLALAAGGCIYYAFHIEPYRIKVNTFTLNEKRDDTVSFKIVQLSDIHIKEDYTHENLRKIVDRINGLNPDAVIFTGDLYDNYAKYKEDENIISELGRLNPSQYKLAIWGNRDYGGGALRQYETIMENAGFILLKNESISLTLDNNRKILFTGLDDALLGNPYMPDSVLPAAYDYSILLSHEPDTVENYLDYNYNIVLSGHSHGGQVKIPFLPSINEKAVAATALSTKYSSGMYYLSEPAQRLYVNTGIGTTHISARFGVVPEITLFHLHI